VIAIVSSHSAHQLINWVGAQDSSSPSGWHRDNRVVRAIVVIAIVPALAQFCVAWVKYPRWAAATAPTITSNPTKRMVDLLVSVATCRVCGGLVVVVTPADSMSHTSHQHHQQTDDENDDADDHAYVGEGEGRNEDGEDESEDDEDDSEDDHDDYLVSV
jgi:hypothetical protein